MRLEDIVDKNDSFDLQLDQWEFDHDRSGRCRCNNDNGESHGGLRSLRQFF